MTKPLKCNKVIKHQRLLDSCQSLETTYRSHLHWSSNPRMQCVTLGDRTDRLSRNVDN